MAVLAFLILLAIALVAAAFVAWPILRAPERRGRILLTAAAVLFVLGLGGGLYLLIGQPQLAERSLEGDDARDLNALIARLGVAVRDHPQNVRGWALLGQAYLTAHDPADAAKAFAQAIAAAEKPGPVPALLYSAYGEALTQASAGAVTPEAEAAFAKAIAADPKDNAARYYLGLAAAARGNAPVALSYWNSLLADLPKNSALRADLVDRVAALTARSGTGAPNIAAMVAGLAARLKAQPDDPEGWQRLVRAYAVLGDKERARVALADARSAMARRRDVLDALDREAKDLAL